MAIRVTCPGCDTANSVSDEQAGKRIKCKSCCKSVSVPDHRNAIQESRNVKAKTGINGRKKRGDDDDDDDDRPAKKPVKKSKGGKILLVLGGVTVLALLLCVVGGIGGVAYVFFWVKQGAQDLTKDLGKELADLQAKQEEEFKKIQKENEKKNDPLGKKKDPDRPRVDPPAKTEPAPKTDPAPKIDPKTKPKLDPTPKPKTDPEPKTDPPQPKTDPEPKIDPRPKKVDPRALSWSESATQATVYLKATLVAGESKGTGFFAIEPGIVVANAHTVGMLDPKNQPPGQIEVTLHRGTTKESKTTAQVIGVDRDQNIAILRVNGDNLPAPLNPAANVALAEDQPLSIFGFYGPSKVTPGGPPIGGLKKDASGTIEQIEFATGISVDNSGGPVFTKKGELIGVAVGGVRGSQGHRAVPIHLIKLGLEAAPIGTRIGEAYQEGNQARLPVKFTMLDPLNRIKEVRVEMWTGGPGQPRAKSQVQPQPAPGDGSRQSFKLPYQASISMGDLVLPALGQGQVLWVQPVVVTGVGTQWGQATPVAIASLLQRNPANLSANLVAVKDRTVKLTSNWIETSGVGKTKSQTTEKIDADILESLSPQPPGASLKAAYGGVSLLTLSGTGSKPRDAEVMAAFKQIPPVFGIDAANAITGRADRMLGPPSSMTARFQAFDAYWQVHTSLEVAAIPVPNKMVSPMESWQAVVPVALQRKKGKPEKFDLELNCTYEGMRIANKRSEGVISVSGHLKGRSATIDRGGGNVIGKIGFDIEGGFISFAKLQVNSESGFDAPVLNALNIDLMRFAGNPLNIQAAGGDPGPIVKNDPKTTPKTNPKVDPKIDLGGKLVWQQQSALTQSDPIDVKLKKNCRVKEFPVQLQAGKKYTIALTTQSFNPMMRLEFAGTLVAATGFSVGGRAHMYFTPKQTGGFRLICTCLDSKQGPFLVTVTEP